ncbi:MAG: nucleoside 2-deoxyribosyltransferase [Chloroflexi bacterium]|nr:nucleoside 2-deoxyribosyltransferase [Chloroflexota bacterium]
MKIYFAGSIRGGQQDVHLYRQIIEALRSYGEVLTEHVGATDRSTMEGSEVSDREIYRQDMAWLESADVLVAETSTPSHGVGYEIARAELFRKPVLCLIRRDNAHRLSAMLSGNADVRCEQYLDLPEAVAILQDFFGHLTLSEGD